MPTSSARATFAEVVVQSSARMPRARARSSQRVERREVVHGRVARRRRGRLLRAGRAALGVAVGERLDPLGERAEAVLAGELQQPRIVERAVVQLAPAGSSDGTVSHKVTSFCDSRACSACSSRFSRRLGCLIVPALASSASRSPNSCSSCAAVLTPMPGTPGTLSEVSPASASTSRTSSGPTPKRAITSARSIAFCFIGSYICTPRRISCIRSLSDETMITSRPGLARLAGVGRDDVVGLVALELDHRQADRARGLAHQRELRREVVGRLEPVGLVVGVDRVAKARLALVEHHHQLVARHVLDQAEQHVAEAVDGADRHALGVGQGRQREERAEDVARPVDQDQAGLVDLGIAREPHLASRATIGERARRGQTTVASAGRIATAEPAKAIPKSEATHSFAGPDRARC